MESKFHVFFFKLNFENFNYFFSLRILFCCLKMEQNFDLKIFQIMNSFGHVYLKNNISTFALFVLKFETPNKY